MLVAEMKPSVQFEALYEGGPQLVIQAWFVVRDWKRLSVRLMEPQGDAWLRLLSPVWSAGGLALSQLAPGRSKSDHAGSETSRPKRPPRRPRCRRDCTRDN